MNVINQCNSTHITWRLVVERYGKHVLHLMRLDAHLPNSDVVGMISALYHREQPWWARWFTHPLVELATVVRNGEVDVESQSNDGQEVTVTRRSVSSLALATQRMAIGLGAQMDAGATTKAILMRPGLSRLGQCTLAVAALVAIIVPGVLLGKVADNAELGITLSATIAGTFALCGRISVRKMLY